MRPLPKVALNLENLAAAAMFFIFFILLFWNLGAEYLWWDEAESAMIAKNILRTGLPLVYDGKNLVTIGAKWMNDADYNEDFIHTQHTWFPYYITAFSFKVLGESNFSARAPFALFGVLSVVLWYCLLKDRLSLWPRLFFLFLMATSVPMLALFRQGRYYSLTCLLFGIAFYSYLKLREKRTLAMGALFVLSNAALFHSSNFVLSVAVFGAFCIHYLVFEAPERRRQTIAWIAVLGISFLLLTAPWLAYVKMWEKAGKSSAGQDAFVLNVLGYVGNLGQFLFYPLLLIAFFVALLKKQPLKADPFFSLIVLLFVFSIVALSFVDYWALRFIAPLMPLAYFISAGLIEFLHRRLPLLSQVMVGYLVSCVFFFPPAIIFEQNVLIKTPLLWSCYGLFNEKTLYLFHIGYDPGQTIPNYFRIVNEPPKLLYSCFIEPINRMKRSNAETVKMNNVEVPLMHYTGLKTYFCHSWSNVSCGEFRDPELKTDYVVITYLGSDSGALNLVNITRGYGRLKLSCPTCYNPTDFECMLENKHSSNFTVVYVRDPARALEAGYEVWEPPAQKS